MQTTPFPIVLVIAGNDPSGGAGLGADIQALASMGCHAAPVVTCITIQDTSQVFAKFPLDHARVAAQAKAVLNDMPIAACKIGLLGSVEIVDAVQQVLLDYPQLPVVLDPVLASGSGQSFMANQARQTIITQLLPLVQVLTPNAAEARTLAGNPPSLEAAAARLMGYGCQFVCITGADEDQPQVTNTLYGQGVKLQSWTWPRLPHSYHGSGCTFAASLAGLLAQGQEMVTAVYEAQFYTWTCLRNGYQPGHGQALPNRIFKNRESI